MRWMYLVQRFRVSRMHAHADSHSPLPLPLQSFKGSAVGGDGVSLPEFLSFVMTPPVTLMDKEARSIEHYMWHVRKIILNVRPILTLTD